MAVRRFFRAVGNAWADQGTFGVGTVLVVVGTDSRAAWGWIFMQEAAFLSIGRDGLFGSHLQMRGYGHAGVAVQSGRDVDPSGVSAFQNVVEGFVPLKFSRQLIAGRIER
jgi:hypothetical protein